MFCQVIKFMAVREKNGQGTVCPAISSLETRPHGRKPRPIAKQQVANSPPF